MNNTTEIKVRGYHLDMYAHVNNARYLEFLEEARWATLDNPKFNLLEKNLFFIVVNINIDYKKPATFGNTLIIETAVHKIGGKSAVLSQKITIKETGDLCIDAKVTFVLVNSQTGKSVEINDELKSFLDQ